MELKVGMYVRTTKGKIDKIDSYDSTFNCYHLSTEPKFSGIVEDDVTKTSYNIIDLIEVGDYVNGEKVTPLMIKMRDEQGVFGEPDSYKMFIEEIPIKSIVTKEQFESIKYSLEV